MVGITFVISNLFILANKMSLFFTVFVAQFHILAGDVLYIYGKYRKATKGCLLPLPRHFDVVVKFHKEIQQDSDFCQI